MYTKYGRLCHQNAKVCVQNALHNHAVNLAAVAEHAAYYDCDVEEPNGHLFLKPQDIKETTVFINQYTAAARMTDVGKNDSLISDCGDGIEFAEVNALTAAVAAVCIHFRRLDKYCRFLDILRFEEKMAVGFLFVHPLDVPACS